MIDGAESSPHSLSVPMSSLLKDRDGGEGFVISLSSPKVSAISSYQKSCLLNDLLLCISFFLRSSLALVVSRFVQSFVRFTPLF